MGRIPMLPEQVLVVEVFERLTVQDLAKLKLVSKGTKALVSQMKTSQRRAEIFTDLSHLSKKNKELVAKLGGLNATVIQQEKAKLQVDKLKAPRIRTRKPSQACDKRSLER